MSETTHYFHASELKLSRKAALFKRGYNKNKDKSFLV